MYLFGIFVIALLCTVGRAEDKKDDPRYLESWQLCNQSYPDANEMEVYYYDLDYMCVVFCWGSTEKGDYVGGVENKEAGTTCNNFYQSNVVSECLEGVCVSSSDVNICKTEAADIGELTSMNADECDITCIGDTTKDVGKPVDSACVVKNRIYQTGKCTLDGMCSEDRTYVTDPDGGNTANQEMMDAVKRIRREDLPEENKYCYPTNYINVDYCEFLCYYVEGDNWDFEVLTAEDGYLCSDDETQHCRGGQCTDQSDIDTCNGIMKEELKRVEFDECEMECKGKNTHNFTTMADGRKCYKMVDGWYQSEGTCVSSVCEVPESRSEDYDEEDDEYDDEYDDEEDDEEYDEEDDEYDDEEDDEEYDEEDDEDDDEEDDEEDDDTEEK